MPCDRAYRQTPRPVASCRRLACHHARRSTAAPSSSSSHCPVPAPESGCRPRAALHRPGVAPDRVDQGAQQRACSSDPAGEQRAVQIDTVTCINNCLPIQRKVVSELRHQHVCQQAGSGYTAFDGPAWRRRLQDNIAATACQLWPHMADHAEAGRHIFQLFRYVFAQGAQAAAAGRACSCGPALAPVHQP